MSSQPSHPDTQQPTGSRVCAPNSGIRHHHLSSVSPRHLPPAPQWSPSLSHTISTTKMPLRATSYSLSCTGCTWRTHYGNDMPPPSLHPPRERSRSRPLPPARRQRARERNRCKELSSQMIVRYQSPCSQLTTSVQHGQKILSVMPPRHTHTLPDTAIATTPRTFTAHFWTCAGLHHHPRQHPHSNSEYRPLKDI